MYLKGYIKSVVAFVLFTVAATYMLVFYVRPAHGSPICEPDCWIIGCTSPLVLDTTGGEFKLTSADDGVVFDIRGDGHPILISWPATDSGIAFLALDRNLNGVIDNGKELFGNATLQGQSAIPNGFVALAEFDQPARGGNEDGVIDENDAVFHNLLLWIDANHDGKSQAGDLFHLSDFSIRSISLRFEKSARVDEYGNAFRYRSTLAFTSHHANANMSKFIYDVYFTKPDPIAQ